eukprot:4698767-Amphidinium_carterae.1
MTQLSLPRLRHNAISGMPACRLGTCASDVLSMIGCCLDHLIQHPQDLCPTASILSRLQSRAKPSINSLRSLRLHDELIELTLESKNSFLHKVWFIVSLRGHSLLAPRVVGFPW